ncbi:Ech-type complex subunit Ech2E [Thermoanaerobacter kivui]|uniref:Ech-type complex subunit Ech2E n=1 Tax=Thermoanaerobacter kivui TaxID=2325 RepID=A0A097ATH9_THEKI|nr:nickel-dependent hydrogenase large subunit [Thermoanaerobacter kivui]AIS53118.1 Ech-type complex subunit Ech2E [Thermoanaerobacter kivui]
MTYIKRNFALPIGPFHIALEEPVHFKIESEGNIVKDVSIEIGHVHRSIEFLACTKNFYQVIPLVERVCGICSHSHPICFVQAIEDIAKIEVPIRARYLRTLVGELERIHSHLLNVGIACEVMGFQTLFIKFFNTRENIKDLMEAITGHRGNYAFNTIGGVRRDINDIESIRQCVKRVKEETKKLIDESLENPTFVTRTKGIGILGHEDAINLSVVGPVARASGVSFDLRKDAHIPGGAYEFLEFDKIVEKDGDVLARIKVRLLEIRESIKIIEQVLNQLPDGPINLDKLPSIPKGIGIGRWEAPRGENLYYCITDGSDIPFRLKIRVPSYVNLHAVKNMLIGQDISDVTLIVASIDPCYSCTQR